METEARISSEAATSEQSIKHLARAGTTQEDALRKSRTCLHVKVREFTLDESSEVQARQLLLYRLNCNSIRERSVSQRTAFKHLCQAPDLGYCLAS